MTVCRVFAVVLVLALTGQLAEARNRGTKGPWDLRALSQVPGATWGVRTGLVQEVYYEGEPVSGKPTRVFAYLARPMDPAVPASHSLPGMVLVHGGGGKAFKEWAEHWANRGYVALAMDLSGNGPAGRLEDGGPDQSDAVKFRDFGVGDEREMWSYHAVAAVIRGHSLLREVAEADPDRVGLTGISWGGYLTCIVAALDHRFRVAVPVYGCGYLGENSVWKDTSLARMSDDSRARWLEAFDPSRYLGSVRCPILFLNGTTDFAYPLDSYQKSYRLVPASERNLSVVVGLAHGHIWTFREVDTFVDAALAGGVPLPKVGAATIERGRVVARVRSKVAIRDARLNYTTDSGVWQKRVWKTAPATVERGMVTATLPADRPLVGFLSVLDDRGLRVSSEHFELSAGHP